MSISIYYIISRNDTTLKPFNLNKMSVTINQSDVEKFNNKTNEMKASPENPVIFSSKLNFNAKEFVPKVKQLATSSEKIIKKYIKTNGVHPKNAPQSSSKADKAFANKLREMGKKVKTLEVKLSKQDKNFIRKNKIKDKMIKSVIKQNSQKVVQKEQRKLDRLQNKVKDMRISEMKQPRLRDLHYEGPSIWDFSGVSHMTDSKDEVKKAVELSEDDFDILTAFDAEDMPKSEFKMLEDKIEKISKVLNAETTEAVKVVETATSVVNEEEDLDYERVFDEHFECDINRPNLKANINVYTVDGHCVLKSNSDLQFNLLLYMSKEDFYWNNLQFHEVQKLWDFPDAEEPEIRMYVLMLYNKESDWIRLTCHDFNKLPKRYRVEYSGVTGYTVPTTINISETVYAKLQTTRSLFSRRTGLSPTEENLLTRNQISAVELSVSTGIIMNAIPSENMNVSVILALIYQAVRAQFGADPILYDLSKYEKYIHEVYSNLELVKQGMKDIYEYLRKSIEGNTAPEAVSSEITPVASVTESPVYNEMLRLFGEIFFLLHAGLSGTSFESALETVKKITIIPRTGTLVVDLMDFITNISVGCKAAWASGKWEDIFLVAGGTQIYFDAKNLMSTVRLDIGTGNIKNMSTNIMNIESQIEKIEKYITTVGIGDKTVPLMLKVVEELKATKKDQYDLAKIIKPRAPPFALQISGEPCTAKSSVVFNLVALFQRADGRIPDEKYIMQPNIAEKYDSTLKEYHCDYVLDDLGQVRADSVNEHMQHKIIAWNNIMASFANRAEIEGKGNMVHVPRSIFVTSNDPTMEAEKLFTYPSAFLRRFPIHVKVYVRPDYRLEPTKDKPLPGLDATKLNGQDVLYALMFRVYKRYPKNRSECVEVMYEIPDDRKEITYDIEVIENNIKQKYMSITNLERVVHLLAKEHIARGVYIVDSISSYFSNKSFCKCGAIHCSCVTAKQEKVETEIISIIPPPISEEESKTDSITPTTVVFDDNGWIDYIWFNLAGLIVYCQFWIVSLYNYLYYWIYQKKMEFREECEYAVARLVDETTDMAIARISERFYYSLSYAQVVAARKAKQVLLGLFSVGAVYGLYRIFKSMKNRKAEEVAHVSVKNINKNIDFTDYPEAPYKYPGFERKRPVYEKIENNVGLPSRNTTPEKLESTIELNQYRIRVGYQGRELNGTGIFIKDKYFVTCLHNIAILPLSDPNARCTIQLFKKYEQTNFFELRVADIIVDEEDRVMFYIFSAKPHADITKYIATTNLNQIGPLSINQTKMLIYQGFTSSEIVVHKADITNLSVIDSPPTNYYSYILYGKRMLSGISSIVIERGFSGSVVYATDKPMLIGLCSAKRDSNPNEAIITPLRQYTQAEYDKANPIFPEDAIRDVRKLEPVCARNSIAHHVVPGTSVFLGSLPQFVGDTPKSMFRSTKASEYLVTKMKDQDRWINPEKDADWSIPILKHRNGKVDDETVYFDPYLVGLAEMSQPHLEPHPLIIDQCYFDYCSIIENLPNMTIGPLNWDEVVNGAEGFNKLNDKAGAGIKFGAKVNEFLDVTYVNGSAKRKFKPDFLQHLMEYEQKVFYQMEDRPIYKGNLKDEIISAEKVCKAGERLFNGSELDNLALMRKYLTPLLVYMQVYPFEFECMAGVNALGQTWGKIGEHISTYPYIFTGDVSKFDKSQLRILLMYFRLLLLRICDKVGYTAKSKQMVWNLSYHFVYWLVSIKGDVFEVAHSGPSGVLVTLIMNSFVMSMLMRLAWYMRFTTPFRDSNKLITLGDDHVNNTKQKEFTFKFVKERLKAYGIKYTNADKSDIDYDFQKLEDITFLKRYFRKMEIKGKIYIVAPIEEKSIIRMLSFTDRESSIENVVLATLFIDAMKQYWFYGRERFMREKAKLQVIAYNCGFITGNNYSACTFHTAEEEPSKSPLRWMTFDEISEMYLNATLQVNFA